MPETQKRKANKSSNGERVKIPRQQNFIKKIFNGDQAAKTSSFLKRKPTLKKKALELQTLCDVSVCVVFFGADGVVDTWPENQAEVKDMITKYKNIAQKEKKESSLLDFLQAKKKKLENQILTARRKRLDELVAGLEKWVDGLSGNAVMGAVDFLESKVEAFKEKIKLLERERKGKVTVVDGDGDADDKQIVKLESSSSLALIDYDPLDYLVEDFDYEDFSNFSMDDFEFEDGLSHDFCIKSENQTTDAADGFGTNSLSTVLPDTTDFAVPENAGLLHTGTYNENPHPLVEINGDVLLNNNLLSTVCSDTTDFDAPENAGLLHTGTYNENPLVEINGDVLLNNKFWFGYEWMNPATPMGSSGIPGQINGNNNVPINGHQYKKNPLVEINGDVLLNNNFWSGYERMNPATPLGSFGIPGQINGNNNAPISGHQFTSPLHEAVPISTWLPQSLDQSSNNESRNGVFSSYYSL